MRGNSDTKTDAIKQVNLQLSKSYEFAESDGAQSPVNAASSLVCLCLKRKEQTRRRKKRHRQHKGERGCGGLWVIRRAIEKAHSLDAHVLEGTNRERAVFTECTVIFSVGQQ